MIGRTTGQLAAGLVLLAVGCGGEPIAGAAEKESAQTVRQRVVELRRLNTQLPTALGAQFGCAIEARLRRRPYVVYVLDPAGVPAARAAITRLRLAAKTSVFVTSPDRSQRETLALRDLLRQQAPKRAGPIDIFEESEVTSSLADRPPCPRVELSVYPPMKISSELATWVRGVVDLYGSRRVVVRRTEMFFL